MFTKLEAAAAASYVNAAAVLRNCFGKTCKQCLSALMHMKQGTQSLAAFLDSMRDLACDGAVDEDVVISVL